MMNATVKKSNIPAPPVDETNREFLQRIETEPAEITAKLEHVRVYGLRQLSDEEFVSKLGITCKQ